MRGKLKIINSQQDNKIAGMSQAEIIKQATINVRYDDAVYPEGYKHLQMKEGDDGYIAPLYRMETEIDQAVLDRFGVTAP